LDPVVILLVFATVKITAGLVIVGFLVRSNRNEGEDDGFWRPDDPGPPPPFRPSRTRERTRRGAPARFPRGRRGYRHREPLRG
jgi:hypothetical protein